MAIAKISSPKDLGGTLRYIDKPDSEFIDSSCFSLEPDKQTAEFSRIANRRANIKNPGKHYSISLVEGESLTLDDWQQFICRFREELGILDCPFVARRHRDTDIDHAHLVWSRVTYGGEVIRDSFDRYKAQATLRKLEKEFGLKVIESSWEKHKDTNPAVTRTTGDVLRALIEEAAATVTTLPKLREVLAAKGVEANVSFTRRNGKVKGISYRLGETAIPGNELGAKFSLSGLQKKLNLSYVPDRDNEALKVAIAVSEWKGEETQEEEDFIGQEQTIESVPVEPILIEEETSATSVKDRQLTPLDSFPETGSIPSEIEPVKPPHIRPVDLSKKVRVEEEIVPPVVPPKVLEKSAVPDRLVPEIKVTLSSEQKTRIEQVARFMAEMIRRENRGQPAKTQTRIFTLEGEVLTCTDRADPSRVIFTAKFDGKVLSAQSGSVSDEMWQQFLEVARKFQQNKEKGKGGSQR